jgi:hypothetical protein
MLSPSTQGVGEIVGGLALTVVAGIFNGSWNAAFNPKLALAVGPESTVQTVQLGRQRTMLRRLSMSFRNFSSSRKKYDLDYHYAWVLFQFYAAIINCIICLLWAGGPANVSFVVRSAPTKSVMMIVVFSFLWGIGSLLFGLSCKIAGVGLGTNLTMSVVLMLGTLLPLLYFGGLNTPTGGFIIAGLIVVCCGLYFSAESLKLRDLHTHSTPNQDQPKDETDFSMDRFQPPAQSHDEENCNENGKESKVNECPQEGQIPVHMEVSGSTDTEKSATVSSSVPTQTVEVEGKTNQGTTTEYSTFIKIFVCILSGIFCSMLQFAFIFGQDLIDIAESDGRTPVGGSAAIIWLFAISIGAIPSIIYGFYSSPKYIPLKTIWLSPWWRHILLICTTCIPWISHIHIYGLAANVLLPKAFAASIAWPTIMTTTVAQGMALSLCLGEWKEASNQALSKLRIGLVLSSLGVVLFMASVAV